MIIQKSLLDIPVIFICPDHNEKYTARKNYMISMLNSHGFKHVQHYKSGSESYPTCLVKATIDILQNNLNDEPFLLLEDDVAMCTSQTIIEYPEDCDAMYLGFSKSAGSKTINYHDGSSKVAPYSEKYLRILNMLSTHAILYISACYKQAVIDKLTEVSNTDYNSDVVISRLHDYYNIYGYYYPFFYQSKLFDSPESETHFQFTSNLEMVSQQCIVTAYYPIKGSKHTNDSYRKWYSLFFECVTCPVICFCPKEMMEEFSRLKRPNVQLIEREFHSFEMMSPKYMNLWNELHKTDPEKKIHVPELYAVWAAKQEFVQNAIQLTESKYSVYIWCDIGCFRERRNGTFHNVHDHVSPGKISCLFLPKYSLIGGGVLAGDSLAWENFSFLFKKELDENPNCKDQVVYKNIVNDTNAVIIPSSNIYGDEWFYLTSLFSI